MSSVTVDCSLNIRITFLRVKFTQIISQPQFLQWFIEWGPKTHSWRENKAGYWLCCGQATGNILGPEILTCRAALPVSSVISEDGVCPRYGLDKEHEPSPCCVIEQWVSLCAVSSNTANFYICQHLEVISQKALGKASFHLAPRQTEMCCWQWLTTPFIHEALGS